MNIFNTKTSLNCFSCNSRENIPVLRISHIFMNNLIYISSKLNGPNVDLKPFEFFHTVLCIPPVLFGRSWYDSPFKQ